MSGQDLAVLVALVALGPWGVVLVVALLRGYHVSIRLRRPRPRRSPPPDDAEPERTLRNRDT